MFFDNLFSSPRLLEHLELQDTYACSTVHGAKDKLGKPGELVQAQKGHMMLTKWHDKVLCKSNANEIRRISVFVLREFLAKFAKISERK